MTPDPKRTRPLPPQQEKEVPEPSEATPSEAGSEELSSSSSAEEMARRMGLTPKQYARGFQWGVTTTWPYQLIGPALSKDNGEWLRHQVLFKYMMWYPAPQWDERNHQPFSGPAWRLYHLLEQMRTDALKGGRYVKFWSDPVKMLQEAGGQEDVVKQYLRRFSSSSIEWFAQIHADLVYDLSEIKPGVRTGDEDEPLETQQANALHNWSLNRMTTFHDATVRMQTVWYNTMVFYPANSDIVREAFELAHAMSYAVTQMHADEWEVSAAVRRAGLDFHKLPGPFKARYQIPKLQRVRFFLSEMMLCPYAQPFLDPSFFPTALTPGVRPMLARIREDLGLPLDGPRRFLSLRDIEQRFRDGMYAMRDPWHTPAAPELDDDDSSDDGLVNPDAPTGLIDDLRLCFGGARLWYRKQGKLARTPWQHPIQYTTGAPLAYSTLERMAALCLEMFVDGWTASAKRPIQRSRSSILSELDDLPIPEGAGDWQGVSEEVLRQNAAFKTQVAMGKLLDMVGNDARTRFSAYVVQTLPAEAFSLSPDGEAMSIEARFFTWSIMRQAFENKGILLGNEIAERAAEWAPDKRTAWREAAEQYEATISETTEADLFDDGLAERDRAFRDLALQLIANEEGGNDPSGIKRVREMRRRDGQEMVAMRRYEEQPGFPLPDR